MKFVLLGLGLIIGTLVLRRLWHALKHWRSERQYGYSLVTDAVAEIRLAQDVKVSGPTLIHVRRHPEELYLADIEHLSLSIAYTPRKGTWWAMLRKRDEKGAVRRVEVEFPKTHSAVADLQAFTDTVRANGAQEGAS